MHKMSNLEYSFLVAELQSLIGKHFGRIRRIGEGLYRMKIGSTEIICEAGVRLHITKFIEKAQPHDKFVEKTEKELGNAKLLAIEQVNNDRIISFNFDKGSLIFEMFGHGNIILVKEGKTVTAMKFESWSDREIRPQSSYKPPSAKPSGKLEPSEKYIIVSMTKLPFGKDYAIEALARHGIDEKTPGSELSNAQVKKLEQEMASVAQSAHPYLFLKEGRPFDFSLARLSKFEGFEVRELKSLSEAADEYYANLPEENPELEKLMKRFEKQKERLELLKEEEKSYREIGDYIYQHYAGIEQILQDAKAGKGKLNKKEKSVLLD